MKPIVFFDIESTGTDVVKDRIVTLAAVKLAPEKLSDINLFSDWGDQLVVRVNPGIQMAPEVVAVHGITNEMIADCPTFGFVAANVHTFFAGCDLAGYNLINFDVPLLWEELNRNGIVWDLGGVRMIDAGNIFKKKEERTLSAAVKFYCCSNHDSAHDAMGDVDATIQVLRAQLDRYADVPKDISELAEWCRFDDRIDLAGKLVRNSDGEVVYNFGNSKGVRVKDDPGFGYWMLGKDFSEQTKLCVRRELGI